LDSFRRFIRILVKHRRFIFWDVLLVTVAVAGYSLVAPKVFTSQAQILPPVEETDALSLPSILSQSNLSKLARLGGSIRGATSSDLIAAILASRTIRERVIDSCDFMGTYRFKKFEPALKKLKELTRIQVTDEGIVVLAVGGKTAVYAARLATVYVNELDRFLRESNMSRGRMMRIFAGQRLAETEAELSAAEDSLTSFQKKHGVTAVDEETKAAIESYARLQAQKISLDMETRIAESIGGPSNPYVQGLQLRNQKFRQQLAQFETGGSARGPGAGFGVGLAVPFKALPDVAAEYARLLTNYRLKQEVKALLVQQYEQARMAEVRDTPAISILDPPRVPERRSFPKRVRMTLIAFVVSLTVGVLCALLAEFWNREKQNAAGWQEWQQIAHMLPRILPQKHRDTESFEQGKNP
jgi:capsule polysaccharide export protein KpsE/RkpR